MADEHDAVAALRFEIDTKLAALRDRFDAIDKATSLQHEDLVRVPTQVDRATAGLRELLEQKIAKENCSFSAQIGRELEKLQGDISVSDERFKGIQTQFQLLKQATEQLDLANKTAIAAALQAQKESAGETQKSSQAAIAKSEATVSEALKALTATFNASMVAATGRIDDIKGRLDRGEGKTSVSDPAVTEALRILNQSISTLATRSDKTEGRDSGFGIAWGVLVAIVGVALVVVPMFLSRSPSDLATKNTEAITKLETLMEQHSRERPLAMPPALSGTR